MGRISELRLKVKDGSASDEEKDELNTLQSEAAEGTEGSDDASNEDGADANSVVDDAKDILSLGKKLGQLALAEMRQGMAQDEKKGAIASGNTEDKGEPKLTGKEKVKAFFVALFDNNHTKLDHLSEGTNADGGFLVPQEYADTFVEDRRDEVVMRRAGATQITIQGSTFNVPQLATRPTTSWTNELAAKSSTSATWSNITLTPYTLAAYMTASNQVIADAKIGGNLVDVITRLLSQAIAEAEDRAFFAGSGSGQPSGLNSYTVPTVNAGGALTADHLINALYTLGQGYRRNAALFANRRTIQVIRQLKDSQNRYIFENAVAGKDFPTVLGMPIYEQNDLESSSIFIGDASGYWIADREGISVRVSDEASVGGQSAFERNFTIVRVEERTDGELADTRSFVEITNTGVA